MKNLLFLIALLAITPLFAQSNNETLKIFLNCNYCDQDYIKQNLDLVEFVRDRQYADVDLLFRSQRNGSGGRMFEIEFIGQSSFSDIQNISTFNTNVNNTENEIRELTLKHIKLGLVSFWVKNGNEDKINLQVQKEEVALDEEEVKDPWNNWVFNLSVNGNFNGQEVSKSRSLNFNASVKRVTEKNKFLMRAGFNDRQSTYTYDGSDIISTITSKNVYLYDVISLDNHWSLGAFARAGESTYSNRSFYVDFKPAIEYNFFDYAESSKKQLTISYKVGVQHNNYIEKTIFGEDDELLWEQELTLGGSVIKPWGNVSGEVSYESFFHDMELDAFSFRLNARIRIIKGLSFDIYSSYSIDNNQINIAAGDLSLEELLLSQQQVSSGYNYYIGTGLSYSFGSLYNTIVNPRFNF